MNEISLATQTVFAELTQRCLDAEFDDQYDERGSFLRRRRKGLLYWYYVRDVNGAKRETYVGPVRDAAINDRVKRFDDIKSDFRQRREMVRALSAAGLPSPDPMAGEVIEALWKAGFFRLRGVLIGTLAFQCYGGILGIRFPSVALTTADADFAQFYDVSHMVQDSIPPILDVLQQVDPTFTAIPDRKHPHRVTRFRTTRTRYLVEFVTPNRGSDEHQDEPAEMPALGGASALPLRYLDFLIHDPVRSALLYKGGIPVRVPSPERFAIHKLIVAVLRRDDPAKSGKDIRQAEQLIGALMPTRSFGLFEVWNEACARGPAWRENLMRGREMLNPSLREQFIFTLQTHGWSEKGLAKRQPKAPLIKAVSNRKKRLGKSTKRGGAKSK